MMSDLQERLRDAITASVDGAQPPPGLMAAVRRRHRRWLLRVSAATAAAVAAVIGAVVLAGVQQSGPAHRPPAAKPSKPPASRSGRPVFPGGGRLLLADAGRLRWLYPDGRTTWIPGSFDGATVSAGEVLAWKYTPFGPSYYMMRLDGSRQRLVLPAGHDSKLSVIQALLSPDGSRLAYVRQDLGSQTVVTDSLWVLDLAASRPADLGPISTTAFAWRDNRTILAAAPDSKSLVLVSATTGSRSGYLAVTDPALVRAYEQARPGAGPPAWIGSDGTAGSGASSRLAVWLAGISHAPGGIFPQEGTFTRPAEVILAGSTPLVTYAPPTPQGLILTWGPDGLVLLRTGAGDKPGSWNAYAGTVQDGRLSQPIPFGMDGATFNPAGNVIALQDGEGVTFWPTPRPACERTARCLPSGPAGLFQPGTVQAWVQ
jgi:hypothetical protein